MEDFIYVIALIAWAAFAYYRKQQKKAEAARKFQGKPMQKNEPDPVPTWQEILLGQEPEPEPEPDYELAMTDGMSPVLAETSFEKEYQARGISSYEELDKKFRLSDFSPKEQNDTMEIEVISREEWLEKIDLRKAVIYAEILNRPYV